MRLGLKLAWRHVLSRPGRSLVIVLGVAAGVAGLHAVQLATQGALDSVRAAFEQAAGTTSASVVPPGESDAPLPADTLARVDAVEGVESALPTVHVTTIRQEELSTWEAPIDPGQASGLLVFGVDFKREPGRGRVVPVDGGALTPGVWLGEAYARERGLAAGSRVNLIASGSGASFIVSGLLAREGLASRNQGQVLIAPIDEVRAAFGLPSEASSEIALVIPDVRLEQVLARLREVLGERASVVRPGERGKDVVLRMGNIRAGTDLTSSLALFLSAFLIYGLFTTAAAERRRETGMLRCVGATRFQAALPLLWEAVICAIPGALLGAALGASLARGVAEILGRIAATEIQLASSSALDALAVGAMGVAVAVLAALAPAVQGARRPPLEAIRARAGAAQPPPRALIRVSALAAFGALALLWASPPRSSGTARTYVLGLLLIAGCNGLLPAIIGPISGHVSRLAARWVGGGVALGAAGPRWRPMRSGLAAGAVLCAVAMVGGISAVGLGVRGQMEDWADRALGWDLFVRRPSGLDAQLVERLRALPGVRRVSPVTIRGGQVETSDGRTLEPSLVGISAEDNAEEGAFTVLNHSGTDPQSVVRSLETKDEGRDRALMTSVLAEQLGLKTGETLLLRTPTGPRQLVIAGEVIDYTQSGFALIVSQQLLAEAFNVTGADMVALRLSSSSAAEGVEAMLSTLPGVKFQRQADLKRRVLDLVDQALSAMDGLLWLAALVGLLAVGSTVALSAFERRADIAALRSLGMSRGQVGAMVVSEAVVTAAVGAFGGVMVGALLGWILSEATHRLGFPLAFVLPWRALLLAATATIFAALPAAFLPARRAMRIAPAEALREG